MNRLTIVILAAVAAVLIGVAGVLIYRPFDRAPVEGAPPQSARQAPAPKTVPEGAGRVGARPPATYEPAGAEPKPYGNYAVVKVFYATDRRRTASFKPSQTYGGQRDILTYGICEVSIPRDHRMGEIERPVVWKLEFREDPKKHVVLLSVTEQDKAAFFKSINQRIASSPGSNAFVFVHGYNTTFAAAARRTAQMTYDLGFNGAPVFYSWPSQGTAQGYPIDEANVEWSQANLKAFLEDFAKTTEAENIFLVAHSMGNRALTGALRDIYVEKPALRGRFKEVILAAPDIDADVFKRDIAPRIVTDTPGVTLYASSRDEALKASKKFHGYPRAGDSYEGLIIRPGIETIDSTDVKTSFLGHSYFAQSNSIIADIFTLINSRKRAAERPGLKPIQAQGSIYWKIEPNAP